MPTEAALPSPKPGTIPAAPVDLSRRRNPMDDSLPRRAFLCRAGAAAVGFAAAAPATRAAAVDIELLRAWRDDAAVRLDFRLRISLPAPVREALQRGVPLYFAASALLKEERWWWRDRRLVRAERSWRLAHLPLTSSWRVGQGGLPVGLVDDATHEAVRLRLNPGDRLFLMSDGLLDVTGRDGVTLGEEGLIALARRNRALTGGAFLDALMWDVERLGGGSRAGGRRGGTRAVEDDISGVLSCWHGPPGRG